MARIPGAPLPFTLNDDEALVQKTVRALAQQVGLEQAASWDRHDTYPADAVARLAELGVLGVAAPEGVGPTAFALAVYEIAQVCPNTAAVLVAHTMALRATAAAQGTGEDAEDPTTGATDDGAAGTLLARLAGGEVASWLATEEAYGSDKRRFGTTAEQEEPGGDWVLNGQKVWGVSAADAAHLVVLAQAPQGPTLFWAERGMPGIDLGRNEPLMGIRAAGIRTVYFSDARVAADRVVGAPGEGGACQAAALPWMQVGVAAALLGCVAGAGEAAARFAEERVQFQKPIGRFQAVSDGVVAMDVQLAAGRALLLEAAASLDGPDAALWAARAKEAAQTLAIPMTRQAIRVQGGTGFMREGGTERFARDVRALQFMGEPFAAQRDTIKRHLLDLEFDEGP